MRNRGIGLGSTVAFLGVVTAMTFAVAGASMQHKVLADRMSGARHATALAESVVSLGVERVMADRTFGANGAGPVLTVPAPPGAPQGSGGRLTFAATADLPRSTNNLEGESAVAGWGGRSVPSQAVHLVGVGAWGGVTREIEAIVHVPRFPYVIAMAGRIESTGGLLVAGVAPGEVPSGGRLDPTKLLPGHIASNRSGLGALVLGPETEITGDVRAAGEVKTDPDGGTHIRGELRPYSDPIRIPRMDVTSYDPQALGKPGLQHVDQPYLQSPVLQGFLRREGDLLLTEGARLEGAVLYVDGNLRVEGRLEGLGAIFVTGTTTLIGGTTFQSDNLVALLSRGDLTMQGDGRTSSQFQGLVYTEGNFRADQISLLGTLIGNGGDGTQAVLSDVNLVHVPENTRLEMHDGEGPRTLWFRSDGAMQDTADPDHQDGLIAVTAVGIGGQKFRVRDPRSGKVLGSGLSEERAVQEIRDFVRTAIPGDDDPGFPEGEVRRVLRDLRHPSDEGSAEPAGAADVEIDPSQFLQLPDRARVVLWHQL